MQEVFKNPMNETFLAKLVAHINRKNWWHCTPRDPLAYRKRGKFLASTYDEAEFWGRPLDDPQKVAIRNPLVGDEDAIQLVLFGKIAALPEEDDPHVLEWRFDLDAKMRDAALEKGYDAIVLFAPRGFATFMATGKIPRSIELNILNPVEVKTV